MSLPGAYGPPHRCGIPNCQSFRDPAYTVLNRRICLTTAYDKHDKRFAYYSQRRDILALKRAPKPLLFVPEIAIKKGFEPSNEDAGEIKLNHIYYEGGEPAKKSRRGTNIGPSKLRNEVLPEEVVCSPPAKEKEVALPLREVSESATASEEAPTAATAATTSSSPITESTATTEKEADCKPS